MEDVSQKMLEKIAEIKASDKTERFDDKDLIDLVYEEIESFRDKGIISEMVVQEMKALPVDKLLFAHEELMKSASGHPLLKNDTERDKKMKKEWKRNKNILIFIVAFLIFVALSFLFWQI